MRYLLSQAFLALNFGWLTLCAQTAPVIFPMTITATGDGFGITADQQSHAVTALFLVSGNGTQTQIPIYFFSIHDLQRRTEIVIILSNPTQDVLSFVDDAPVLNSTPGRSGTATLKYGTGAFHFSTGSINYSFACTLHCGHEGGLLAGGFLFQFQASGTFTLPPGIAKASLPSVTPPPPPTGFAKWIDGVVTKIGGPPTDPTNGTVPALSEGVGHASPAAEAISIVPPWQIVPTNYTATATCANLSSACWLTVSAPTGSIAPFTSPSIPAVINQGKLGTGVYPAGVAITLTPSDGSSGPVVDNVPAMLIVSPNPLLQVSETGVSFQTVAGSATALAHDISIASSGPALPYTASSSTLAKGNWLTVSPASGTGTAVPAALTISANPAGLAAGTYFGRVDINAPGSLSPLQSVTVQLTVAPSANTIPVFSTTGLIFVAPQGTTPAPQVVNLSTLSSVPVNIETGADAENLLTWLVATGSAATLRAGQPFKQTVTIDTKGLSAGVYLGKVVTTLPDTGAQYPVQVALVVTPANGACSPAKLVPVLTNLTAGFELPAGSPVGLQAQVVDDCGSALKTGAVQASFGTGDTPATLTSAGNGRWAGTWQPHGSSGGQTSVVISAQSFSGLVGTTSVLGTMDANASSTIVSSGGIVNAAAVMSGAPVAPGEFISIYGSNLASTTITSPIPYLSTLGGTRVYLGGQPLPLQFVSAGQINALVPFGTPVNGFAQLIVEQNGVYSQVETVVVASANPAVFTQDQSGQGSGVIVVVKADGTQFEATATQPASSGDALVIYCTGLGAVNPTVTAGAAASATVLSNTVNPVTVTVGGQSARVLFAGLAPGFSGLYQVNVVVPAGTPSGPSVPVVVTAAGFPSSPVTIAIQ